MSLTDELIRRILDLPESRRLDVLHFVDALPPQPSPAGGQPRKLYGLCADLRSEATFEDFQQVRREIWGHPEEEWDDVSRAG